MSMESTKQIEAAAAEWLIRRDSQEWSSSDQVALDEWLNASTLHRVGFLRLELAWEEAARLKALAAGGRADGPPPPGNWNLTPFFDQSDADPSSARPSLSEGERIRKKESYRMGKGLRFALAASVLLVVAGGLYTYQAGILTGDRYTTPVGAIESVSITDGSKVTLNTDSQIRVSLTDTERRVELKHGEAFFEVAHDARRPFIVRVGNKRVIAVGTKFSVRRDGNDDIQVVVTEGKVRIESAREAPGPGEGGTGNTFLTPGAIARASDVGVLVQRKTLPEAEEQLSWRSGILQFRNQTLADAIAEFNRYNSRKLVIDDPSIAALTIEGNFRSNNVAAFARLLETGYPIRVVEEGDRIILMSK
jgi:transmembrane sensor